MRQSQYFLKTSKTVSDDDKIVSARLLKRAGYIRESVAGRYFLLPAAQRVRARIMQVIKEEMDAVGAHEMLSPVLHPLELWQETNRTNTAGFELMKVKDRRGAEFALGGTAEEMFVDLVRKFEISYKDLPFQLYQFSTKFRDELRARGGLLRVREFTMKDGYSFHTDEADFRKTYEVMKAVYSKIFERVGLKTAIVESDNGYIGGEYCHEFIVESESGESRYFVSADGTYAAHEDVAVFKKNPENEGQPVLPLKKIPAKRGRTMEDGVKLHGLPLWQQIKDVVFVDERDRCILSIIRGDYDVNESKLKRLTGSRDLRHATDEEIYNRLGSAPGFISPVDIRSRVKSGTVLVLVADDSLLKLCNMYGGANEEFVDLININFSRDIESQNVDIIGDIALARPGDEAVSGGKLSEKRGIEVGNIFQLGYHYTNLMRGAVFTDATGEQKPYYMGCYGIGVERTLATIVEKHHDERGIVWPDSVAPFDIHLIALDVSNQEVLSGADRIYQALQSSGRRILYDDRDLSAGAKFADADLIGIPLRVVISSKTLAKSSVEVKKRGAQEFELVDMESFASSIP